MVGAGQQQRVAGARRPVGSRLIRLADEPTGNLDSPNGEADMDLLRELHQQGATICMVTHDPRFTRHADRNISPLRRPGGRPEHEGDAGVTPIIGLRHLEKFYQHGVSRTCVLRRLSADVAAHVETRIMSS